jgi:hypothetical protein
METNQLQYTSFITAYLLSTFARSPEDRKKRSKNGGQKKVAFAFLDVSWMKDGLRQSGPRGLLQMQRTADEKKTKTDRLLLVQCLSQGYGGGRYIVTMHPCNFSIIDHVDVDIRVLGIYTHKLRNCFWSLCNVCVYIYTYIERSLRFDATIRCRSI